MRDLIQDMVVVLLPSVLAVAFVRGQVWEKGVASFCMATSLCNYRLLEPTPAFSLSPGFY